MYANYGGHRLNTAEREKLNLKHNQLRETWRVSGGYTEQELEDMSERLWMYSLNVNDKCDLNIDIPSDFETIEKYSATLGHKVNHSFKAANSRYTDMDSPR